MCFLAFILHYTTFLSHYIQYKTANSHSQLIFIGAGNTALSTTPPESHWSINELLFFGYVVLH